MTTLKKHYQNSQTTVYPIQEIQFASKTQDPKPSLIFGDICIQYSQSWPEVDMESVP